MQRWLCCLCLCGCFVVVHAQEKAWQVRLQNKSVFYGFLKKSSQDSLYLQVSRQDSLRFAWQSVSRMREVFLDTSTFQLLAVSHPAETHTFTNQNAIGLRKGEAYYQSSMLLYNSFNIGITDFLSIEPVALLPLGIGVHTRLHTRFFSDHIHVGAGLFTLLATDYWSGFYLAGAAYPMVTVGDRDKNITLSGGVFFSRELGWSSSNQTGFGSLSTLRRVSPRSYLMMDIYRWKNNFINCNGVQCFTQRVYQYLIWAGARTHWRRFGLGYGLLLWQERNVNWSSWYPFPWINFSLRLD
ncbi:MAG: hypothetical protein ACFCUI_04470 [Bernardetiaceae bacterium]